MLHDAMAGPSLSIDALRRALSAAAGGAQVDLVETHISWVLLAGEYAYKLKKPVRLPFLDFGTVEARRHFCAEELRLNRRLAPSIYLDVLPVRGNASAPRLDGHGEIIDWALRMRRFPAHALFVERLAAGTLLPAHIDGLARRIAEFHARAPIATATVGFGTPDVIVAAMRSVLGQLAALDAAPDAVASDASLSVWADQTAIALTPHWQCRLREGRVREGHGDLHLANAVVLGAGDAADATAFDCIEFDPALRWIDVLSDAGFLMMDLLAHGRRDYAWRFLNAYLERSGDYAGLAVLRYYLVYRALVRALVARLRAREPNAVPAGHDCDYLGLARALASTPQQPALLITHGLSGSGKTWLAQRVLEAHGALRLRSDVERKRLFGLDALAVSADQVPGGIYTDEATRRTYARLREYADAALAAGWPVIVDAAFLRRDERAAFRALADAHAVPFLILDCRAAPDLLRDRVRSRAQRRADASEAGPAVLERQFGDDEPPSGAELACTLTVDTGAAIDLPAIIARWAAGA